MNKRDRQGVRTATDLERKYKLGRNNRDTYSKAEIDKMIAECKNVGIDVTFHNENKEVIAFYSVKAGTKIRSPNDELVWVDKDGVVAEFPFAPRESIDLYVLKESVL